MKVEATVAGGPLSASKASLLEFTLQSLPV